MRNEFEDIRPYLDHEVPEVIERLLTIPAFFNMMQYVQPEWIKAEVIAAMMSVNTVEDFQRNIAHPAMRRLVDSTVSELTVSGLENLKPGESYLFISNHRDIILDSAILNIVLLEAGLGTIQTAIGSNLLTSDLVADLTKLNKNFVVKRNTGAREFYENSMLLSDYIRYTIGDQKQSIWIAQREGRTKDGLDKTQPGLLKMLSINCQNPLRQCLRDLRITPVAISYEFDPCDTLKIPELKAVSRDEKYEKAHDEDINSILTGLTGQKGRVHLSIGTTLNAELEELADYPNVNDKLRIVGDMIDQQIYLNYKLWPSNYLALDLLDGNDSDLDHYSKEDRIEFEQSVRNRLAEAGLDPSTDMEWLLKMYANPVRNHLAVFRD